MKIKKQEIIELSEKEDCAFQVLYDGLEDIRKSTEDPVLIDYALDLQCMLKGFYEEYCKED